MSGRNPGPNTAVARQNSNKSKSSMLRKAKVPQNNVTRETVKTTVRVNRQTPKGSGKMVQGKRGPINAAATAASQAVIKALTLPGDHTVRITAGISSKDTGVFKISRPDPVSFGADDTDVSIAVFRSALCASIRTYGLGLNEAGGPSGLYTGSTTVKLEASNKPAYLQFISLLSGIKGFDTSFLISSNAAATGGDSFHGPYQYACKRGPSDDRRAFWVDTGASVVIATDLGLNFAAFAGRKVQIIASILVGEKFEPIKTTTITTIASSAPGAIFTFGSTEIGATGAYVSFEMVDITPNPGTIVFPLVAETSIAIYSGPTPTTLPSLTFAADPSNQTLTPTTNSSVVYAHRSLYQLETQFTNITDIKLSGCSACFTNTSNLLARQGQIAGVQLPSMADWRNYLDYSSISSLKDAWKDEAATGCYGFLKPTDSEDLTEYLHEFVTDKDGGTGLSNVEQLGAAPGLTDGAFIMPPPSGFIVIAANVQIPTGTNDTRAAVWTTGNNGELLTENQWRETHPAAFKYSLIEPGLDALSRFQAFHENPLHIDDIWSWIKDKAAMVVDGVLEYGPMVIKGAAMAAPFLL
jgi:hypothetical protein